MHQKPVLAHHALARCRRRVQTGRWRRDVYALDREPTGPGEILSEEFLKPLNITQRQLAEHIGYDVKVISRIVNGRTPISAELAIRLARALNTSPEFWLNAQQAVDVFNARRKIRELPEPILMD